MPSPYKVPQSHHSWQLNMVASLHPDTEENFITSMKK